MIAIDFLTISFLGDYFISQYFEIYFFFFFFADKNVILYNLYEKSAIFYGETRFLPDCVDGSQVMQNKCIPELCNLLALPFPSKFI